MTFEIGKWCVEVPVVKYLILVSAIQLLIRLALTALHAYELTHPARGKEIYLEGIEGFSDNWWQAFWSSHQSEHVKDYWHPTMIGLMELLLYPPLIAHGSLLAIGGWIGIKTAVQWPHWGTSRSTFNRFLIGNALVVTAAFLLATIVRISPAA